MTCIKCRRKLATIRGTVYAELGRPVLLLNEKGQTIGAPPVKMDWTKHIWALVEEHKC